MIFANYIFQFLFFLARKIAFYYVTRVCVFITRVCVFIVYVTFI